MASLVKYLEQRSAQRHLGPVPTRRRSARGSEKSRKIRASRPTTLATSRPPICVMLAPAAMIDRSISAPSIAGASADRRVRPDIRIRDPGAGTDHRRADDHARADGRGLVYLYAPFDPGAVAVAVDRRVVRTASRSRAIWLSSSRSSGSPVYLRQLSAIRTWNAAARCCNALGHVRQVYVAAGVPRSLRRRGEGRPDRTTTRRPLPAPNGPGEALRCAASPASRRSGARPRPAAVHGQDEVREPSCSRSTSGASGSPSRPLARWTMHGASPTTGAARPSAPGQIERPACSTYCSRGRCSIRDLTRAAGSRPLARRRSTMTMSRTPADSSSSRTWSAIGRLATCPSGPGAHDAPGPGSAPHPPPRARQRIHRLRNADPRPVLARSRRINTFSVHPG